MKKTNITDIAPFYNIPLVEGRRIHLSGHLEIVHLALEPGGAMEAHSMPTDVFFYVLDGSGNLYVNDVQYSLGINEYIEVPKDALRSWHNDSDFPLNLLVIKSISDQI